MDSNKFVKDAQLVATLKSLKGLRNISKTNTGKFVQNLKSTYNKGGLKSLLDEASKFNPPAVNVKSNPGKAFSMPDMQKGEATLGRGLRAIIGTAADNVKTITKGTGSGTLAQRAKKLVQNTGTYSKNQFRGSQYTEKELRNLKPGAIFTKGDKTFLKGKRFAPDREVVQNTGRGVMVKKRLPLRAISPLTTSPGVAGAGTGSYITQSVTEPEKSTKDKLKRSVNDGSRFLLGNALGFGSYLIKP